MKIPGLGWRRDLGMHKIVILAVAILLILGGTVVFASSGGEHAEEGAKGWQATDTYRVMNFAVLAIALFFLLRKPMSQALNGRIQGIKDQLQDLEAQKEAAEKELAKYNQNLAALEKEAESMIAEYVRQGEEAKSRILKEAETSAQRLKDQAKKNIESEFQQARQQLQQEVVEQALAKAEEIIRAKITDADQDKLVDEYLEKVVA